MNDKTYMDLQATIEELAEDNRILQMEKKNMRRGLVIVYGWLRGTLPYCDLAQDEIESMLEKAADMP